VLLLPLAVKPMSIVAPAASEVAHVGAFTVQLVPLTLNVPFQPLLSVTPDGKVQVTAHGFAAEVPLFVTFRSAWKPPGQLLVMVYTPVQPPPPPAVGDVLGEVVGEVVGEEVGDVVRVGELVGEVVRLGDPIGVSLMVPPPVGVEPVPPPTGGIR